MRTLQGARSFWGGISFSIYMAWAFRNCSSPPKDSACEIESLISIGKQTNPYNQEVLRSHDTKMTMNTNYLCPPSQTVGIRPSLHRQSIQRIPARCITSDRLESLLHQNFPSGNYEVDVGRSQLPPRHDAFLTRLEIQVTRNVFTIRTPKPLPMVRVPIDLETEPAIAFQAIFTHYVTDERFST